MIPGKPSLFTSIPILLAALPTLLAPAPSQAAAEPVPWEITADSLIHLSEPESVLAEGNVILARSRKLVPDGMVVRADWLAYDRERGLVRARGNVHILSAADEISARSADLDLATNTGSFTGASLFIADSQMFIRGDELVKTGEFTYSLKNGWISACRTEEGVSAPWSFEIGSGEVTLDGMARLHNVSFHIKDAPLLYTPYLIVPAKTKRESGFLRPQWQQSSRDGFGLSTPYFLNLSPSTDATLYPGYMAKRGVQYGAEFRYTLSPESHGTFLFSYLQDKLVDGENLGDEFKDDRLIRSTENRFWLRGKADHDFGNNLVARLDLDLVSDQDFLQEFDTGAMGFTANRGQFLQYFQRDIQEATIAERVSSLQLVKSSSNMLLAGELRLGRDVSHDIELLADDGDGRLEPGEYRMRPRPVSPLQTLPRLSFVGRRTLSPGGLSAAWDTEYTNYWRDRGLGGHRLDLSPRLITALPRFGGWLEGWVSGGVRETAYRVEPYGDTTWNDGSFLDRQAVDLSASLATSLLREFRPGLGGGAWLEHLLRPSLLYEYLSASDDPGFDRLALDGADALAMKNRLTWQLGNYFTAGSEGEKPWSRNLGFFKLLQSVDLRDARSDAALPGEDKREWSDLRADLEVEPSEYWKLRYQTNLSMYGKGITRYHLTNRYGVPGGHSIAADYRYLRNAGMEAPYFYTDQGEMVHDLTASVQARLTGTISASAALSHSFATDHTSSRTLRLGYKPHCWGMLLEFRQEAGEEQMLMVFSLDGIGPFLEWDKDNF